MHVADVTTFCAGEGGEVKRYLHAKRQWLKRHTRIKHTLLIPGASDLDDGAGVVTVASPRIPLTRGYRWPIGHVRWGERLRKLAPDLIEVGDPYGLAWTALEAGARLDVPVVGVYHTDLINLAGSRLGSWCQPGVARYVRHLYARFDLVIVASSVIAETLRAAGVKRVEQLAPGVDVDAFAPTHRDPGLRVTLGLPGETRLMIHAGRRTQEKDIALLMKTMRRLGSGYHLLFVGGDPVRNAAHNVTCLPYPDDESALAWLLASADMLVHPTDQERVGRDAVRAMACGIPVVGVAAGAMTELVDSAVGMLAQRPNARALAQAIITVYERDPHTLGRKARERVEREHAWGRVFRKQVSLYEALVYRHSHALEAAPPACG